MLKLILTRVFQALFVLLAISVFLFISVEILPGDMASVTAPRFVTSDQIDVTREEMGLNASAVERYGKWMWRLMHGDLGISWSNRADIGPMLADGLKNTALLALMASCFSLPIGFITALSPSFTAAVFLIASPPACHLRL